MNSSNRSNSNSNSPSWSSSRPSSLNNNSPTSSSSTSNSSLYYSSGGAAPGNTSPPSLYSRLLAERSASQQQQDSNNNNNNSNNSNSNSNNNSSSGRFSSPTYKYGDLGSKSASSSTASSPATSPTAQGMRSAFSQAWGNIRFCAVGRTGSKEIVTSHNGWQTISTEKFLEVCQMLVQSKVALDVRKQTITVDEEGRCMCCQQPCDAIKQTGSLHFLPTASGWVFIVITSHNYSQRLANRMLDEVKRTFEEQIDLYASNDSDRAIARRVQLWLPALCDRYDKLDTSSSVRGLAAQIDAILR